jgi:branched-chain amino acid transport system substrate-binding protein
VRRPALLLLVVVLAASAAGCGGGSKHRGTLLIVVNAPFSQTPYVGNAIAHGVSLAANQVNVAGGLPVGNASYHVRVERRDTALSPRRALANVRRAVAERATAIVDEGTGIDASWRVARAAGIPICIVYQGGMGLVDPVKRPNVFRIAPTDHGLAFRLAEYLVPKGLRVALLHDDSGYGADGAAALDRAFAHNQKSVALRLAVPTGSLSYGPQVLRARGAHATALLVWGQPATIGGVVSAARSSGWKVPIYAPPAAQDPVVRQELAAHPSWLDGLTFASGRLTAELGPQPYYSFAARYASAFGQDRVGVKTAAGLPVVQPPEIAMYAYDFANVLFSAVRRARRIRGDKVLNALEETTVRGTNGDERGFSITNHEGVVDDDVYFARFHDMTFLAVKDDPLSATLPVIKQTP